MSLLVISPSTPNSLLISWAIKGSEIGSTLIFSSDTVDYE